MSQLVFFVPILAVLGFFVWLLALSPVGRAFADRLRQRPVEDIGGLKGSVEDLRREVAELTERMDFTERLLAERRDPSRLERGDRAEGRVS